MHNEFLRSKKFKMLLIAVLIFVGLLASFRAGMEVGFRKATFSCQFGDNYFRTFGGDRGGRIIGFGKGEFSNTHGVTGKIIKLELPTFIIEDRDNTEKVVRVDNDTEIRKFRDSVKAEDLKVGDFVIVIGSPDSKAEIGAKIIRLLPPSLSAQNATSTIK